MRYGHHLEMDSLVSRRLRLMYVVTPKVACTSIKWAISRADGAYTGRFNAHPQPTPAQVIHSPSVHGLPKFAELSGRRRRAVLTSDEWVRFCVTRSPYERLVSGWANKVLMSHRNGSAEVLASLTDLGIAFRSFVEELAGGRELLANPHFAPQSHLLDIGRFPYTDVVDLADLDGFFHRLRESDAARSGLVLGERANEGLSLRADDMYDARTAALVENIYARDFELLGYATRSFANSAPALPVSENERRLMTMVRNTDSRILEMSRTMRSPALVGVVVRLLRRHAKVTLTRARHRARRAVD